MFETTTILINGLIRIHDKIKKDIEVMQWYYIIPGSKKEILNTYGFSNETTSQLIRITKAGWKCFSHDSTSYTDDDIEYPDLTSPSVVGYAVPSSEIPIELTGFLLDDRIIKQRLIPSRDKSFIAMQRDFFALEKDEGEVLGTHTWNKSFKTVDVTEELLYDYIDSLDLYECLYVAKFIGESIQFGKLHVDGIYYG